MVSLIKFAVAIFAVVFPLMAAAQVECGGSLAQKDFSENIKALNAQVQENIDEYRKLEIQAKQAAPDSAEAKAAKQRMTEINSAVTKQKAQFKELNSPNFPETQFTVYGAACTDRRWVLRAKEVLVERPELLGQHFHVWMEKGTRKVQVSQTRPALPDIAN